MALHYFGPAHTNGDSFVHFENANIVHTGDLLFNRRAPFVDKTAGANISNWQEVMEKGYETFDDDTLFVFGHSGNGYEITGKRADLKAFQNYLRKVIEFVKKAKQEVKPLRIWPQPLKYPELRSGKVANPDQLMQLG